MIISLTILTLLTSCSSNEDVTPTQDDTTTSQGSEVQPIDYDWLEEEITTLLEAKSYINLCSVTLDRSPLDNEKMTFDVILIGENLISNQSDILEVFQQNSDQIDYDNSVIKDDVGVIVFPRDNLLPEGNLTDWNLILLNHDDDNKLEQELNFEQAKYDTQYVDARAGVFYQQMCDAALKDGITLYLRSGYRTISTQVVNYNANIDRLKKQGSTEEEAIAETNLYYTKPGHSEHHTGLAFDIITPEYHDEIYTLSEKFAETEAYEWLIENCAEYGFILRYAEDKTDLTQINFEPWHYRYVGKEHAKYIMKNDLCLEEYIALLKLS